MGNGPQPGWMDPARPFFVLIWPAGWPANHVFGSPHSFGGMLYGGIFRVVDCLFRIMDGIFIILEGILFILDGRDCAHS